MIIIMDKDMQRNKRRGTPSTPLALSVSQEGGAATSSSATSTSTNEQEDMANCLILLTQGSTTSSSTTFSQLQVVSPQILTHDHQHQIKNPAASSAATATSVVAAAPAAGTSTGSSYECKTCNRCFPSFQALGGHRASHKKPKLLLGAPMPLPGKDKREAPPPILLDYCGLGNHPALPLMRTDIATGDASKAIRAHECTICGARFVSGQALGGHMRRHRRILGGPAPTTVPVVAGGGGRGGYDQVCKGEKVRGLLPHLDLNLPAPDEYDEDQDHNHREQQSKFVFAANEKSLILSASSLVDCHYSS